MRIDVRFLGIRRSLALVEHARERASSLLGRDEFDLSSLTVRLDDTNGPKGGVCKACYLVGRSPSLGEIHVKAVHDNIYMAIADSLERLQRTLWRRTKRLRRRPRASLPLRVVEQRLAAVGPALQVPG